MEPVGQLMSLKNHAWRVSEPLATGGFASVYRASSDWRSDAVVKLIPKDPGAERELLFEDLSGVPNVVPILDRGEWEDRWVLVMPKADKSLRQHLQEKPRLDTDEAVPILRDVAEALVALENRVVHRDIKPENILLLDGRWCLADFGISRYAEATTASDTRKLAKTPAYAAPEQWREERATSATDVYAMGVVAYELLAGKRPFSGPDYRSQHLEDNPGSVAGLPPRIQSLVQACLIKAPQARLAPRTLLEQLNADWEPSSHASRRLQEANELALRQKVEQEKQESIRQSEEERRQSLLEAGQGSFNAIVNMVYEVVRRDAPECEVIKFTKGGMGCFLNEAKLEIAIPMARRSSPPAERAAPFDVMAFASIALSTGERNAPYEGRSHSLWFCDAAVEGEFRWYETAFRHSPFMPKSSSVNPFDMQLGQDTYLALAPGMHTIQVAWPFTAIDQGGEADFIERWIGWFADAATGQLRDTGHMPDPTGSWRIGD